MVVVEQGYVNLVIAYRSAHEDIPLYDIGKLAGEFQPSGDTPYLGKEVRIFLNLFDGKVKNVYFEGPGLEIEAGDLRFVLSLVDISGDSAAEIPESQIKVLAKILSTVELVSSQ